MRALFADTARGLRQHAAGRRAVRGDVHRGRRPDAPVPAARGRGRDLLVRQGGRARAAQALAGRHPRPRAQAGRLRGRDHHARWASRGTSSWSPTSSTGPRTRASASGPGRGSAAGSLAAYAMGITDLDPLAHGLIFERFLNPERVSMPDVDIDFDDRRRGEVIRYVSEKYGEERVSQIVTYGTIKAKAAIKDAARVLDRPVLGGRRADQADAAGRDGQGHPAVGDLRPDPRALQGGRGVPGPLRVRPGRRRGRRPGAQARGPEAAVGRARGRRDHRPLPADRQRPDHAARGRRRGHHAVRLPDLRDARPAQDGLPGPAQPHRPRRRAAQHRRQRQGAGRPRRDQQGPHRQGHLRAARPR